MSLEAAAASARGGFACMFSTSDEYETALITRTARAGPLRRHAQPLAAADVRRLHPDGRRHRAALQLSLTPTWQCRGAARRPFSLRRAGLETSILQRKAAPMITEIAQIDVKPGTEKDFEAAVAKARAAFRRAKGGNGFELHKSIEKPQRYRLMVEMGDAGKPHRRFPRLGEFHGMARAGRAVFCLAARGRAHRDGADLGRSERRRVGRVRRGCSRP